MIKWLKSLFAKSKAVSDGRNTTEFSAEVVRIASVSPHPNAERLDLIRFEMKGSGLSGYEVVSQKGSWKPGDLAAYFSVDCLLPVNHPEFAFLKERTTKPVHRLRAARLRGVFSQGLLVPTPKGSVFGAHIADHFGVTYHSDPEPEAVSSGGVKKPKKQPMPIYGVDSLRKCPRLFEDGEEVVITEKIHGTNFRFGWVRRRLLGIPLGWKFVVGSHRVIKGEDRGGHFYGEDVWSQAAEKMGLAEKTRRYKGFTFYGEIYGFTYSGGAIQDLVYGRTPADGPGLAIFDVLTGEGYLLPVARHTLLGILGLPEVPFVHRGPWHEGLKGFAEGKSYVTGNHIREGIVVEAVETRKKAKYVGEGYLLRDNGKHAPKKRAKEEICQTT